MSRPAAGSDGAVEPGVADGVGVAGVPGGLVVSGGGSTAVATDGLFVDAARLGATTAVVTDWIDRAAVIRRGLGDLDLDSPSLISAAGSPTLDLAFAAMCLDQVLDHATWLRSSLLEAAERYGATERFVDGLWQLAAFGGAAVARAPCSRARRRRAPRCGWRVGGLDGLACGGVGIDAARRVARASTAHCSPTPTSCGSFARPSTTCDETVGAAAHVPLAGLLGLPVRAPESASVVLGLAGALGALGVAGGRVLVDGPVRVTRLDRATAATVPPGHPADAVGRVGDVVEPPAGIGDLADRVPRGDTEAQIRIERYGTADDPRWIVYVGGTVEFGLTAGEQPADMTSNIHGIADDSGVDALRLAGAPSAAGERAVRLAMSEAGVQPGDPLLAVGYSGGGVIAAKLAADPELNVVGAVNLGGPVASAPTREGVGLLSIEHDEDLVPATGGAGHPSPDRVTVSRSVLEPGREYEAVVPAHELARYRADGGARRRLRRDAPRVVPVARRRRDRRRRRGCAATGSRPATSVLRHRTQDEPDQPADEAEHEGAEHAPPEVRRSTRPNPMRSLIHATSSSSSPFTMNEISPKREHVQREGDDAHERADEGVDEAEDQRDQEVREHRGERRVLVRHDADARDDEAS